jgi:hypothetical protein
MKHHMRQLSHHYIMPCTVCACPPCHHRRHANVQATLQLPAAIKATIQSPSVFKTISPTTPKPHYVAKTSGSELHTRMCLPHTSNASYDIAEQSEKEQCKWLGTKRLRIIYTS